MAKDPFPRAALEANRAGRLTAEQVASLQRDARESKKSGVLAGIALLAVGCFILWGTAAGRVPGPLFESFAVGAALAGVGALLLVSRGMSRGPRAAQAASGSTVLEVVEGPVRRECVDKQLAADLLGSTRNLRGDARYDWLLHIGDRRLRVGRPEYEAAPEDGVVRAWLLPGSDRIVNLERIADVPPTEAEARARALMRERMGEVAKDL